MEVSSPHGLPAFRAAQRRPSSNVRPGADNTTAIWAASVVAGASSSELDLLDVLYEHVLRRISQHVVFGDRLAHSRRYRVRVDPVPRRYFCAQDSRWGDRDHWDDSIRNGMEDGKPAWHRCVQMKFVYATQVGLWVLDGVNNV